MIVPIFSLDAITGHDVGQTYVPYWRHRRSWQLVPLDCVMAVRRSLRNSLYPLPLLPMAHPRRTNLFSSIPKTTQPDTHTR